MVAMGMRWSRTRSHLPPARWRRASACAFCARQARPPITSRSGEQWAICSPRSTPEEKVWRIIPADANDYPHAPWWTDENGSLRQGFGAYEVNPRAELVGQLHTYTTLVPADWLDDLTERTIASIEAGEQEEHALICAVRLAETKELPARYRDRLAPRVRELVKQTAALDPAAWSEYGPQPLWYVSAPDSLCAADLADATQTNLDFLIAQQAKDGSWKPTFNWGGMYPDEAAKSERDSTSALTL